MRRSDALKPTMPVRMYGGRTLRGEIAWARTRYPIIGAFATLGGALGMVEKLVRANGREELTPGNIWCALRRYELRVEALNEKNRPKQQEIDF